MDNYFIKSGYKNNSVKTFNDDGIENYWNDTRLETSKQFQFDVYRLAKEMYVNEELKSVLDVGAGPGTKMNMFFNDSGDAHIIDQPSVQPIANRICPNATFHDMNLDKTDFSLNRTFDMIICADVIEHLDNPDNLLDLIKRHMGENSILIMSTPERDTRRGVNNQQSPNDEHVREWNKDEFKNYIESKGFLVRRHINIPIKRISSVNYLISNIFGSMIRMSEWNGAQLIEVEKINN